MACSGSSNNTNYGIPLSGYVTKCPRKSPITVLLPHLAGHTHTHTHTHTCLVTSFGRTHTHPDTHICRVGVYSVQGRERGDMRQV